MKHIKKYMNSIICVLVLLMAVTLNITPEAYEMLLQSSGESREAWISQTIYQGPIGRYIVVKGGAPEAPAKIEDYTIVRLKELRIYVPNNMSGNVEIVNCERTKAE